MAAEAREGSLRQRSPSSAGASEAATAAEGGEEDEKEGAALAAPLLEPAAPSIAPSVDSGTDSGTTASRSRRRHTRSPSPGLGQARVTALIDEELALLRPRAAEQAVRRERAQRELEAVRLEVQREARHLRQLRSEQRQRRRKLASRMQAAVRGWLSRRKFVIRLHREFADQVGMAALLPDQLQDQLKALQHNVHDLEYSAEDRVRAAVRLQAWWRSVTARRAVWVLQVASQMRRVHARMVAAAMRIQAWFRAYETRTRFRVQILINMGLRCSQQMEDMERLLQLVVRLQRAVRGRIARRRVQEARRILTGSEQRQSLGDMVEAQRAAVARPTALVDSWQPGGIAAGTAALLDAPCVAAAEDTSPKREHELERLEEYGLVPFYWSSARENVRHRVGGPTALKMHRRLGIGAPPRTDGGTTSGGETEGTASGEESLEPLGNMCEVYPEGLSAGFLDNLDEDAWPWDHHGRKKKQRKASTKRGAAGRPRRPACRLVVPAPPTNAERRAQVREEAQAAAVAAAEAAAAEASGELHPLLANAPVLERAPAPPPGAPPRGRPRPCPAKRGGDDDGSWSGATGFFGGADLVRWPRRAASEDWPGAPVEERLGSAARGGRLLSLAN